MEAKRDGVINIQNCNFNQLNVGKFDALKTLCMHHFRPDLINYMNHMHISGTEPSSVILSQGKLFKKLKNDAQKCQNKMKPNGIGL